MLICLHAPIFSTVVVVCMSFIYVRIIAMANQNKNDDIKEIEEVEFKVPMYCNACERSVAKAISKFKGVETFTTDMNKHSVVVKGQINPHKLLKKLKKKTKKRVEIITTHDKTIEGEPKDDEAPQARARARAQWEQSFLFDFLCEEEVLMMFSEENPNACSIM